MSELWVEWEEQIKTYCGTCGLDIEALYNGPKQQSGKGDRLMFLLDINKDPDYKPMAPSETIDERKKLKILLIVEQANGELKFTQTEHTLKYIGMKNERKSNR